MEKQYPTRLPLDKIVIWKNTRTEFDEKDLQEMADSIIKHDVIQAVIVRPYKDGLYQLICGERRLRGSQIAAKTNDRPKTIPVSVRELNDDEALDLQIIENLQRKDVNPMDEASAFQQMLDTKRYSVADIAAKVVKPETFVIARLKLNDLIPELQSDLRGGLLSIGHATLCARLTPEDQKLTYKEAVNGKERNYGSLKDMHDYISKSIVCSLSSAGFKKDDAELLPKAGACTVCPKRSGANPGLFPDVKEKDRCFDKSCFGQKSEIFLINELARIIEEEPDVVIIRDSYRDISKEVATLCTQHKVKILKEYNDFYERNKSQKGVVKAFWVNGNKYGQYTYVEIQGSKATAAASAGKPSEQVYDDQIKKIKDREIRAKELDQEKIHKNVSSALGNNKAFVENKLPLSLNEYIALAVLVYDNCGYGPKEWLGKLLKVSGCSWNTERLKVLKSLIALKSEAIPIINEFLRKTFIAKMVGQHDDPTKQGSAAAIRILALDYMADTVKGFDTEQSEKALKRQERVNKRIDEVKAEKKAFMDTKAIKPAAKKAEVKKQPVKETPAKKTVKK